MKVGIMNRRWQTGGKKSICLSLSLSLALSQLDQQLSPNLTEYSHLNSRPNSGILIWGNQQKNWVTSSLFIPIRFSL